MYNKGASLMKCVHAGLKFSKAQPQSRMLTSYPRKKWQKYLVLSWVSPSSLVWMCDVINVCPVSKNMVTYLAANQYYKTLAHSRKVWQCSSLQKLLLQGFAVQKQAIAFSVNVLQMQLYIVKILYRVFGKCLFKSTMNIWNNQYRFHQMIGEIFRK